MKTALFIVVAIFSSFAAENCDCDVWFAIDDPDTTKTNILAHLQKVAW